MTYISRRLIDGEVRQRTDNIGFYDLWHTQCKPIDLHEARQKQAALFSARSREDETNGARDGKASGFGRIGHREGCDCYRCQHSRQAYVERPDLTPTLKRRHDRILSIALWTNPAKASDVLKRFHRAKAHYAEMALRPELASQGTFLATTYEYGATILWARMLRRARMRDETKAVSPRSDKGTIGRTSVGPDQLWVCPHPECGCQGIPWRQRRRLLS